MGAVRITSSNPNFNRSHFGLPPSSIHTMTGWVANSRTLKFYKLSVETFGSNTYQGTSWIWPTSRRRNAGVVRLKSRKTPRKIIRRLLLAIWQQTRSAAWRMTTPISGCWHVVGRNFRWSMVTPKLKRHLNAKNTLSDHDSIHGHQNLNETKRSAIARYRNFNAPKICKITVLWCMRTAPIYASSPFRATLFT